MTPLPEDEFLEAFKAALQADENDEAVYGWMVEESGTDLDIGRAGDDLA